MKNNTDSSILSDNSIMQTEVHTNTGIKVIQPVNSDFFPDNVAVYQTTVGMPSTASGYAEQNMAFHVADFAKSVHGNRMQLLHDYAEEISSIHWLTQVHGTEVVELLEPVNLSVQPQQADAFITQMSGVALAIMTADCLPVLLVDQQGREVAAIHAGWSGLVDGIIQKTIAKMTHQPKYAWIGAAIHQNNFEVGHEVFEQFTQYDAESASCFRPSEMQVSTKKWFADLPKLAERVLSKFDIETQIHPACSYASDEFYSHRQGSHLCNTAIGRMASLIWIKPNTDK